MLGIITRQNVSEVAGRHAEVHLVAQCNGAFRQKVTVGGDVIHDLRQHAPPVDGVGRRQEVAPARQLLAQNGVGENALDAALRIVEVSAYRAHADVFALLADHLQLLDLGHAAVGVEDKNFRMVHITETLERCLAGVAGGCDENADLFVFAGFLQACREKIREHLQRHVLERARRTVPQLQDIAVFSERLDGRGFGIVKFCRAVCLFGKTEQFFFRKFVEIQLHKLRCARGVGKKRKRFDILQRDLRNFLRQEQTAVAAESLDDCLRRRKARVRISGTYIVHCFTTFNKDSLKICSIVAAGRCFSSSHCASSS